MIVGIAHRPPVWKLVDRSVRHVSRHRSELSVVFCGGVLFRFEAFPVGDEGEQIVVLQWRIVVHECEPAMIDHIAVIAGRSRNGSIQLGLGHRSVLGEGEQGETKTAAPERFRSG